MRVIGIKHIEDCFDGSFIKELLLADAVTREHIFALGSKGEMQYFPHFARPFFKVRLHGAYDIKGIEGNTTIRVHLKDPERFSLDYFIDLLNHLK